MSPTRGLPEAAAETSAVTFGKTTIPYFIRRSAARRTVSIAVHPGFGVVVTAPSSATVATLDNIVHDRARWVVGKLRTERDVQPAVPRREFTDGETFLYLGRQYRLKLTRGSRRADVSLRAGRLVITVPGPRKGPSAPAKAVKAALVAWYRQRLLALLPARAAFWSSKLGIEVPTVLVRDQRGRWASCDRAGVLRFNWRIAQAPMRLLDYVVAHELIHVTVKAHTPRFWARLASVMPDYDVRREELRRVGRRLTW